MSNIIDALLVTLSLDPSGFKAGSKDADKALKDTGDAATRHAKEMEAKGKQAAQFFAQIRNQVIALAATFTAGAGLKEFISNTTRTDAAVGRTARNIGIATETLTAWQGVAERAGGTADGMAGSLQGLSQQFQQLYLTGQSGVVPYFRAVGVALADANGKARPFDEVLLDLSDKLSKMDPARAQALGKGMGLDEGTINVLLQGRAAIGKLLEEQKKLGAANATDAAAAAERQKQFNALGQASADLGRKLLTALTPALTAVLNLLTRVAEWFAAHPTLFAIFAGAVGTAAALLTAALTILSVKGFVSLIANMLKVPAAAATAAGAIEATAATTAAASATMTGALGGVLAILGKIALTAFAAHEALKLVDEHDDFGAWMDEHSSIASWLDNAASKVGAGRSYDEQREASDAKRIRAEAKEKGLPVPTDEDIRKQLAAPKQAGGASGSWEAPKSTPPEKPRMITVISPAPDAGRGHPSSARAPSTTPAAREQAQLDIRRFMDMGWSRAQATGIVANVQRESAGNEKAVGDGGSAFGLAQWHPDRQREFFKQFGKDIRDSSRDEQLQFINYELRTGKEKGAGDALAKATDPAQAAAVISRRYERPGDAEGEASRRADLAALLYRPAPDPAMRGGAATAVAANNTSTVATSTSHAETHIGSVQVNLPNASDAESVAKGLGPALQKNLAIAQQANFGLTS